MHPKTEGNLKAAFAGESQAHMKYLNFADKAEKEGFKNVARLFTAVAFAERVHASGHLRVLSGVQNTAKNLEAARAGEDYEVNQMYPAFQAEAEKEGEKAAVQAFVFAVEAEKLHSVLYGRATGAVGGGKDLQVGAIHVCPVCGHTVEGDAPDQCPVCGAKKEMFRKF